MRSIARELEKRDENKMDGRSSTIQLKQLTPCDHSRKQPVLVKTTLSETQFEL